jgi:diketogulonate reductase-like aldo/keto reductase
MEVKELADTGVRVPEIGLGVAGYTGGVEPLRRGIALGANHIDTAENYETEHAVGEAIKGIRDDVFLATKVSGTHLRHDDVLKAAEGSLRKLGTDYIDLYILHAPSPDIPIEETMRAMDRLVDEDKVRFIGVSNFSVEQLKEAQTASRNKITSNQVRYNLADRAIEAELLPYCQENKITIVAYSPLAAGLGRLRAGLRGGVLKKVADESGKTEAQVALSWCTCKEGVIAIPKSSSVQRTEENCGASGWRLSDEHLRLLDEAV